MPISATSGPVVAYGATPQGNAQENPDRGPSLADSGFALLDPRLAYTYQPGQRAGQPTYGFLGGGFVVVDQAPSALSATNIALAQIPANGVPLTLTAGAGVTGATTIARADTGVAATGLLAIDGVSLPGTQFGGANGSVYAWNPAVGIARNVRVTSVGADTGTMTVRGFDIYGFSMVETITMAGAGIAAGKKAFKYIQSITPANPLSGSNVSVGTGDVYGFGLRVDAMLFYTTIFWNNAQVTATTGFVAADTTNPATAITGDVRGTYAVQGVASDGTRRLQISVIPTAANIASASGVSVGLFGVSQFTNF